MRAWTFQAIIFAICILPLGGCNLTPDQRVAALDKAVTSDQAISQQMDARIQQLEQVITNARAMLADPNITNETLVYLREALPKLEAKLAAAKPVKQIVDQNLAALQKQLAAALTAGPVDLQKEFATYGQGVTSTTAALPAPFNLIGLLIGSIILPLVGGIIGAIAKGKQAKTQLAEVQATNGTALRGIVASVSALLNDVSLVPNPEAAKDLLAREQVKVPAAAAAVRAALNDQASMTFTARTNASSGACGRWPGACSACASPCRGCGSVPAGRRSQT